MTARYPNSTTDYPTSHPITAKITPHRAPSTIAVPHRLLELSVAIPARDEQESIVPTLVALSQQVDARGKPLDPRRFEVIVLANGCRDDTAAMARAFGMQHPELRLHVIEIELPAEKSHIGRARRLVMDLACERLLQVRGATGVIATTDADTVVDRRWVAATLDEMRPGRDAVGGRILLDADQLAALEPGAREMHLRDVGYRYLVAELESLLDPDLADPWPRHFQHFGASLAIAASSYVAAGGLPVRRSLEDVAMYDRLRRVDARIRHSPSVRVWTSARQTGRTEFGFAVQLSDWSAMRRRSQPFLVEPPAVTERRLRGRAALRRLWRAQRSGRTISDEELAHVAGLIGVPVIVVHEAFERFSTFGALAEDLQCLRLGAETVGRRHAIVPIEQAIPTLRARLSQLRRAYTLRRLNTSSR